MNALSCSFKMGNLYVMPQMPFLVEKKLLKCQIGAGTKKDMEKEYKVKSDRYGHVHKFVQMPTGYYAFVPEQDWMPLYITKNKDGSVSFVDTDGGPCIGVGFETDEIKVVALHDFGQCGIEFQLEEKK